MTMGWGRFVRAGALGIATLSGGVTLAQDTPKQVEETRPVTSEDSAAVRPELVIVADADNNIPANDIQQSVLLSAQRIHRKKTGNPSAILPPDAVKLRSISKQEFDTLTAMLTNDFEELDRRAKEQPSTKPVFRKRTNPKPWNWELDLGGNFLLKSLKVNLRDGKLNKPVDPVTFDPSKPAANPNIKVLKLSTTTFDVDLTLPANVVPTSYSIVRTDPFNGNKELPEVTVALDRDDSHWLITINGFDMSDRQPLFVDLASKDRPNPVRGLREMPLRQYVLGSMKLNIKDFSRTTFTASTVKFRIDLLGDLKTNSAYMLFPLTEEKAKALASEYNLLGAFALPKEKIVNPALAGDKTTLTPGMEARWFEIPRTPDGLAFQREVQLTDVPGWKKLGEQKAWRLLVWVAEEDGGVKVVNRIPDPLFRANSPNDAIPQILVVAEEIKDWPLGIQRMASPNP